MAKCKYIKYDMVDGENKCDNLKNGVNLIQSSYFLCANCPMYEAEEDANG